MMDSLNINVEAIAVAASVLTAAAACVANILITKKDKQAEELKIRKFKGELKQFILWYQQARHGLNQLHDDSYKSELTSKVLSDYRKISYPFCGTFTYWENDREDILMALERNYNKDAVQKCESFMDRSMKFVKLSSHLFEVMGQKKNGNLPYHEFCEKFIQLCPDAYIAMWGGSFNSCLRYNMVELESEYKEIAGMLGLEPVEMS